MAGRWPRLCRYKLLRLLPDARLARPSPAGPLNFVALMADPLVQDDAGRVENRPWRLNH